jgi:hypothetical protein
MDSLTEALSAQAKYGGLSTPALQASGRDDTSAARLNRQRRIHSPDISKTASSVSARPKPVKPQSVHASQTSVIPSEARQRAAEKPPHFGMPVGMDSPTEGTQSAQAKYGVSPLRTSASGRDDIFGAGTQDLPPHPRRPLAYLSVTFPVYLHRKWLFLTPESESDES